MRKEKIEYEYEYEYRPFRTEYEYREEKSPLLNGEGLDIAL